MSSKELNVYVWKVLALAVPLGYDEEQVTMFLSEIEQCFLENKTPEECIEEVF